MVRDTTEGKTNFLNILFGPMLDRWATHLTKGREKYPDPEPGVPNWTLAQGRDEFLRAKESAFRHFLQWMRGDRDEDHAAAVFFNINLAEYALAQADAGEIHPGLGATTDDGTRPEEPVEQITSDAQFTTYAPVPAGYERTGEFRVPRDGEPFISFDGHLALGGVMMNRDGGCRWILREAPVAVLT
jgi:hypothetical protein